MKNIGAMLFVLTVFFNASSIAQGKKPDDIDVVSTCKTDCPEAKSNAEAHECAERKGKIRPAFKKSKCWEVNEEYEALVQAAPKTHK